MEKAFASSDHRTVVVGVDGTPACPATVEVAVAEAVRRSARLLIVHAWPGHYHGPFRVQGPHRGVAQGSRLLTFAAEHAASVDPGLVVETELRPGLPGEALADCCRDAGLLVVGHRNGQINRADWGSTARLLARACPCPLLVHRGRADPRGPVVVGVSGRPAEPALGYAFAQAVRSGADLVVIHAWRQPPDRAERHPFPVARADPQRVAMAEALAGALAEWSWQLPQVPVTSMIVPDLDVPYTLQRASRRSRLLVAGTGGRGRLTELIGEQGGRVASHQGLCPVLLVPPDWPVETPAAPHTTGARVSG
ncbi:universal stress protein [Actinoplanes palleronii]|uniref:Universal stress protein n=1 Tax=Actinoplanes palleronii TaxID=113570 RepID=A0ABQ4BBX3_9ACTN|nr:universal stress protein [Actinoplanes palleronii]GIE68194.1 universal stress protein [Actinoplanes palleronii]